MIEKSLQPKRTEVPPNPAESLDTSFITKEWVQGLVDFNEVADIYSGIAGRVAEADKAFAPNGTVVFEEVDHVERVIGQDNQEKNTNAIEQIQNLEIMEAEGNFVMQVRRPASPHKKTQLQINTVSLARTYKRAVEAYQTMTDVPQIGHRALFELYVKKVLMHELMHLLSYDASALSREITEDQIVELFIRTSGLSRNEEILVVDRAEDAPDQLQGALAETEWESLDEASTEILSRAVLREYLGRTGNTKEIEVLEDHEYFSIYRQEIKVLEALALIYTEKTGIPRDVVLASFMVGRISNPHAFRDALHELGIEDSTFLEFLHEYKKIPLDDADALELYINLNTEWADSVKDLASRLGLR